MIAKVFVPLTENYFGITDKEEFKVFESKQEAEEYKNKIEQEKSIDVCIVEREINISRGQKIFLVLNEDFYGGDDFVKIFSSKEEAENYKKSFTDKMIFIQECQVL